MEDHDARLTAEVDALLQPLQAHYDDLTREIRESEEKTRELRRFRTRIVNLMRVSNPDFGKRPYSANGKPKAKSSHGTVSDDTLARFSEYLVTNVEALNALNEGEGFYATQLARDADTLPGAIRGQQSRISLSLRLLHERGVVRIASKGKGSGGRIYYKVIA